MKGIGIIGDRCKRWAVIAARSATNRFNPPVTYDDAGSQKSGNSGAYVYWWYPTGQMRQFDGSGRTTIYGYTADGGRVGTYDSYAPSGVTYTLRGLDGKVLRVYRESGGVWTWQQDYVYRDGALLATIDSTGTRHVHLDHLGSIRLITNSSGSQVALHTYYPFGQEATNGYQDTERMKFTGHERDLRDTTNTTDDLDSMHARYHNPNLGRFLSVDPGRDSVAKQPQSWNLYSYVRNNPLNFTDPTGAAIVFDRNLNAFFGWGGEPDFQQNQKLRAALSSAITNILGGAVAGFVDQAASLVLPSNRAEAINSTVLSFATPLSVTTTAGKGAQVVLNAVRGSEAEAIAAKQLVSEGNKILGSQVSANTFLGRRVIDHLIETPGGRLVAVEVKSGAGVRTATQVAKDVELASRGAVLVGKYAPRELQGATVVLETIMVRIP